MKKLTAFVSVLLVLSSFGFAQSGKVLNRYKYINFEYEQIYIGEYNSHHYFVSPYNKKIVVSDANFRMGRSRNIKLPRKSRFNVSWAKIINDKIYIAYSRNEKNNLRIFDIKGDLLEDEILIDGYLGELSSENTFSIWDKNTKEVRVYKLDDGIELLYTSNPYSYKYINDDDSDGRVKLITNFNNTFTLIVIREQRAVLLLENYKTGKRDKEVIELSENIDVKNDIEIFLDSNKQLVMTEMIIGDIDEEGDEEVKAYGGVKVHFFNVSDATIDIDHTLQTLFGKELTEMWNGHYRGQKNKPEFICVEQIHYSGDDVYLLMSGRSFYVDHGTGNSYPSCNRTDHSILITKFSGGKSITKVVARKRSLRDLLDSYNKRVTQSCLLIENEGKMYLIYNDTGGTNKENKVTVMELSELFEVVGGANIVIRDASMWYISLYLDLASIKREGNTLWFFGIRNFVRYRGGIVEFKLP